VKDRSTNPRSAKSYTMLQTVHYCFNIYIDTVASFVALVDVVEMGPAISLQAWVEYIEYNKNFR